MTVDDQCLSEQEIVETKPRSIIVLYWCHYYLSFSTIYKFLITPVLFLKKYSTLKLLFYLFLRKL